MDIRDFDAEQLRIIANIAMQYDSLIETQRSLEVLPYHLKWHTSAGYEYLYEIRNARGDGRSLGPRSAETEAKKTAYDEQKEQLRQRQAGTEATLGTTTAIWRTLKLPTISHEAAKILQELDVRGMLGTSLLVVGTNAFAAYEIEAGGRFLMGWDATEDFDLAWTGKLVLSKARIPQTLFGVLKKMDSTFTINSERTFQARNAKAYEVELLSAPSVQSSLPRGEMNPIPLEEQEWLLLGTPLEHVVASLAAKPLPARIVAPDPRWMALHKMWLSRQPKRAAAKRPKDARQGAYLLMAGKERMPRFALDDAFQQQIPAALQPIYEEWLNFGHNFNHAV